jgi:hypothetical protein
MLSLALPRLTSHPPSTTPQTVGKLSSPTQQQGNINAPGPPVSLANLPRLLSQITGNKEQPDITPQKALQTIQTAILLSRQVRKYLHLFELYLSFRTFHFFYAESNQQYFGIYTIFTFLTLSFNF